jgi:hypothetical protein
LSESGVKNNKAKSSQSINPWAVDADTIEYNDKNKKPFH